MTDSARPNAPNGPPRQESNGEPDLASFFQDWTTLWRQELQAQANEQRTGEPPGMDMWRAAMALWAEALPAALASGDRASHGASHGASAGAAAVAAASDARDAEIERLTRRIDGLEARLAKLEAPRRRRS